MKTILLFVFTSLSFLSFAQSPVKWEYSVKKVADKTYEVHLTAIIDNGWHTFSQTQPKDAIPMPTGISFNKNPLVQLKGKIKEVGQMEKYKEKVLGTEQYQYSGKVDFVQTVVLKNNVKTNISGSVSYQTCNDHECLPPTVEKFSILIGN
jgi:hypothetical protein